ncbi:hypothetical protein E2C01_009024 [Portunus trituberculatus]|uniref:Uncharacterized protein n=1 Tax=Portunus trituberculatus TaxID=210409 RepID=A0A5B7D544_PORTR|nr:hypothetical protein [Portunus trituberculatus]
MSPAPAALQECFLRREEAPHLVASEPTVSLSTRPPTRFRSIISHVINTPDSPQHNEHQIGELSSKTLLYDATDPGWCSLE